jgi:hypothetical protein
MLRVMRRLILLAALLVGCKEDKGPPCDKVVDHMLEVTKQALPGHDTETLGDRKAMIDQCDKRNMPRELRKCLMSATSLAGFADCQSRSKPAPAPTRPLPSTAGSSSAPSPTGSAPTAGSGT